MFLRLPFALLAVSGVAVLGNAQPPEPWCQDSPFAAKFPGERNKRKSLFCNDLSTKRACNNKKNQKLRRLIRKHCPAKCMDLMPHNRCKCTDSVGKFEFDGDWVKCKSNKVKSNCSMRDVWITCPKTCNMCPNSPSSNPSGAPSSQPSQPPSSQPSQPPSATPSQPPSSQPSATPSQPPSATPSQPPSSQPSAQPSQSPIGRWSLVKTWEGDSGDVSGYSVAMSEDGKTVAVGAPHYSDSKGYVLVYTLNPTDDTWNFVFDVVGDADGDQVGETLPALSDDGTVLAYGAWRGGGSTGYVKVYKQNPTSGSYELVGFLTGDNTGDSFGRSVALSGDGGVLAVGATGADDTGGGENHGALKIYRNWGQAPNAYLNTHIFYGFAGWTYMGETVAMSEDGETVMVGMPAASNIQTWGAGTVVRYDRDPTTFQTTRTFHVRGDAVSQNERGDAVVLNFGDKFGEEIACNHDCSIYAVGATGYDGEKGIVKVFIYRPHVNLHRQLGQDIVGAAAGDRLGWSLALSRDGFTLAVGSFSPDINGADSGQAKVYFWDSSITTWVEETAFDGPGAGDQRGASLALAENGSLLAIGSSKADDDAGLVEVLRNNLPRVPPQGP